MLESERGGASLAAHRDKALNGRAGGLSRSTLRRLRAAPDGHHQPVIGTAIRIIVVAVALLARTRLGPRPRAQRQRRPRRRRDPVVRVVRSRAATVSGRMLGGGAQSLVADVRGRVLTAKRRAVVDVGRLAGRRTRKLALQTHGAVHPGR